MESEVKFFATDQSQRAIKNCLSFINGISSTDDFETTRNEHIKLILGAMQGRPDEWDTNCAINIEWIGSNFVNKLSGIKEDNSSQKLNEIYATCFRFLFELYFSIKNDLSHEFDQARRFAMQNIDKFDDDVKSQIEFAIRDMPIAILKKLINHESIDSIKQFNKVAENADKFRTDWNKELEAKTAEVNTLKNNLEQYKAAFNFVGLYQGFDELSEKKHTEKNVIRKCLIWFGFAIVVPIITELVFIMYHIDTIQKYKTSLIMLAIPTISLIGLLIYYFRIFLFNFNSVKSQILQLDLRKTLCRFIQNYANYSTEIKKKDKDSLTKFENIVFSGLVANDEKLPSTFDGVEQLAALIKSVKS